MSRRVKIEHTEDFQQIQSRCDWPEQVAYERIRSTVVFGDYVAETARHTGTSESTLRRKVEDFDREGMLALFDIEQQEQQSSLDPETRALILNLKAEYPPARPNEIGTICYIRTGERPHHRTIKKVLEKQPTAIRMFGRFYAYHDTPDSSIWFQSSVCSMRRRRFLGTASPSLQRSLATSAVLLFTSPSERRVRVASTCYDNTLRMGRMPHSGIRGDSAGEVFGHREWTPV